ncbi:Amino acid/polyamine transporter I [Rhypophila sp. PSN 637]
MPTQRKMFGLYTNPSAYNKPNLAHCYWEVLLHHDEERVLDINTNDITLLRRGKSPVLKRAFTFWSILGLLSTILVTWEIMLIISTSSLINGSPAGVLYGFIIIWLGTFSSFAVLSELASMAPTAGGQYHWVALLLPPSCRRFASYMTGWMTIGWMASCHAIIALGLGGNGIAYEPKAWQTMLFYWAVVLFAACCKTVPHFEKLTLVVHLAGVLALMVPLVFLVDKNGEEAAGRIFTKFVNEGGWSSQGLSFLVGLPAVVFTLMGADSAVHMAEEIKNASTVVPNTIMTSTFLIGALGLVMTAVYLICLGDQLGEALQASKTYGFPFIYVLVKTTGFVAGTVIMCVVIDLIGVCSSVSILASNSRMLWSFARDRGVPFWRLFVKLDRRTGIPLNTVAFTAIVSILLLLITLGSEVAFSNIVNLGIAGLYSSYFVCCCLLLWRRVQPVSSTTTIKPYSPSSSSKVTGPENFQWGPWRVPGVLGTINNAFACFWTFWPAATSVIPQTMNFNVSIFGGVMLLFAGCYLVKRRKDFDGPIVEVHDE